MSDVLEAYRGLRALSKLAIATIENNMVAAAEGFKRVTECRKQGIPVEDLATKLKAVDAENYGNLLRAQVTLAAIEATISELEGGDA